MKIDWSPRAVQGYFSVLDYLKKEWGDRVVQSFVSRVDDILKLIIANPDLFPVSKSRKTIRRCVITKHTSLYYRLNKSSIELIAFIDNRSNPKKAKLI